MAEQGSASREIGWRSGQESVDQGSSPDSARAHPVSLSSLFCHFELWVSHLQILRGYVTCFEASRHG